MGMTATTTETIPLFTPGDFLRKAREFADMTQRQLAGALGVDVATVRGAEKGRWAVRPERVTAWAVATGVSAAWLQWNVDACGQADMNFDLRVRPDHIGTPSGTRTPNPLVNGIPALTCGNITRSDVELVA